MIAGILKENQEARVVMVPPVAKKMIASGYEIWIESGAGEGASFSDQSYQSEGVQIKTREEILTGSDLVLSIHPIAKDERSKVKGNAYMVSIFSPRANPSIGDVLAAENVKAFSMDAIPRITIAQSMDVLSSMASLAGYKAVLMAANHLPGYFPMLMTAAGTIPPSRVLVLGAGVAGLQAIATARRLGATVEAFDVRAAVIEEVQRLRAKFIEVEGATEDKGAGGYAVELTVDYRRRQKELIHERASKADVIITTANIPGRTAPILIETATVEAMNPGSVIVDLAAGTGGNCELTQNDEVVVKSGVTIVGDSNLPGKMARDASILLANNYFNFIKYVFEDGSKTPDFESEIVKGTFLGKKPEPATTNAE